MLIVFEIRSGLPRVQNRHAHIGEVPAIASNYRKVMFQSGRGEQAVDDRQWRAVAFGGRGQLPPAIGNRFVNHQEPPPLKPLVQIILHVIGPGFDEDRNKAVGILDHQMASPTWP